MQLSHDAQLIILGVAIALLDGEGEPSSESEGTEEETPLIVIPSDIENIPGTEPWDEADNSEQPWYRKIIKFLEGIDWFSPG
jgi:hypothetical protein